MWDYSGHFFHFKYSEDRALAARADARRGRRDRRKRVAKIRYARPRHRLPVPEAHPPAAARRVPRVPDRAVLPPAGDGPPRVVRRDAVLRGSARASPRSSCGRTTRSCTRPISSTLDPTRWAGSSRTPTSPTSSRNMRPGAPRSARLQRDVHLSRRAARSSYIHALLARSAARGPWLRRAGDRDRSRRARPRPRRGGTIGFDQRRQLGAPAGARADCAASLTTRPRSRRTRCWCSTSASTPRAAPTSTGCTSRIAPTSFYRVGWYDNILGSDRMSLYVEIGAPNGTRVRRRRAARARARRICAARASSTTQQLVAHHHVVLDPAYVHITRRSLAETARLRDAARRARRPLGRPLRRLDLLLDRGQPDRDPRARGRAVTPVTPVPRR